MRSPIQLPPVTIAPTTVEAEFAAICKTASQDSIANACGLTCHTTISERFGKAVRKGFLASFTAEQFMRMAAGSGPVQVAALAYWREQSATRHAATLTEAEGVRREIGEDATLIAKCNAALDPSGPAGERLTKSERADLILELRKSVDHRMQLIARMEQEMREGARP